MARTTPFSCACRVFFLALLTAGTTAFTPVQRANALQGVAPRPSAAADVPTLKRDIAQNLRVLRAQKSISNSCCSCEADTAASTAALKEITARLYDAPASSAWTTATTSAVAAVNMISSSTSLPSRSSPSRGGGATVLDRPPPPLLETDTEEEGSDVRMAEKFKLMLFNDSGNTREYVARSLVQVVGLEETSAFSVMIKAHKDGMAQVGVWAFERAECYCDQLKTRGIISELFPVD